MEYCELAQTLMNKVFYGLLRPMVVQHIFGNELLGALWPLRGLAGGKQGPEPAAALTAALPKIEAAIDGPYLLGATPCYADVSLFAILRECLDYSCFDRQALLAPCPKLTALLDSLEVQAKPWIDQRVEQHQFGIRRTIELFAAQNSPIPAAISSVKAKARKKK